MNPTSRRLAGSGGAMPGLPTILAIALTLAGCGDDAPTGQRPVTDERENSRAATPPSEGSSAKVVVTRDEAPLPDGCGPAQTAGLIAGFFRAFNAGDVTQLRRTFAATGDIGPPLYGVGTGGDGRGAFGTDRREELLRYFAGRHRRGERLRLLRVEVGPSAREGAVDVAYFVARSADDLGSVVEDTPRLPSGGLPYFGKGVIDCGTRRILAWNMDVADGAGRREKPGAARGED